VIRDVVPPSKLSWTRRTLGVPAIHVYRVSGTDGDVTVRIEGSWDGLLARISRTRFRSMLQTAIYDGLIAVRQAAEAK
jgi:hypothetical protein